MTAEPAGEEAQPFSPDKETMLSDQVSKYLQANRDKHLAELLKWLAIPSIANKDDGNCDRAAEWIAGRLAKLGLTTRLAAQKGKPNVIGELHVDDDAPTVLIYGHYDVQPAEPLELWETPPFQPTLRDGWIYARGADDDKGQFYAHAMAIEALRETGGVPVNVKVFVEGEEEIGSPTLEPFMANRADELACDVAVISDSGFFADGVPSITYSLRGLAYVELTLSGPNRDLHSGLYGGAVANPINALAGMIAKLHDEDGKVAIPGFYDEVVDADPRELAEWAKLPFDESAYAAQLGLDALAGGEKGRPALERLWARPTLDCNGIVGGFTEQGAKTVIASKASAKISMRLVPAQDPEKIVRAFEQFVAEHTPSGLTSQVQVMATARPVMVRTDSPEMNAAKAAFKDGFGKAPAMIRCGASVPVTELIQRILGVDAVLMGFGLPEDRLHSPNERFRLDQLHNGAITSAAFLQRLREVT